MDMGKNHHHTPTFKYLPTKRLSNLPKSTPPPRLWTMDMGKNHHIPTNVHLPTKNLKNIPISTPPPNLWTMDMKEGFFMIVVLLISLVGFLGPAAVSHAAPFVLYYDKVDSSCILPDTLIFLQMVCPAELMV
jgi:hypothetical protein